MSHKLIEQPTPLALAQAALEAADAEVKAIEAANRGNEEKFGGVLEAYNNCVSSAGTGSPAARQAAAGIAAMRAGIARGRVPLDAAKRRVAQAAERLASEHRARAIAREGVRQQQQRVARQREILAIAGKVVEEKKVALDRELGMLAHFRGELNTLTGGAEPSEKELP